MQRPNADILNHLYSLLMETNFHQDDEDVFTDISLAEDTFIQKHLKEIKLKTAKYKALRFKNSYNSILAEIKRLKEVGFDEVRKLLNPKESIQLQPLFNKFEELSKKDEESITEDQELLQLISLLKNKLNNLNADE